VFIVIERGCVAPCQSRSIWLTVRNCCIFFHQDRERMIAQARRMPNEGAKVH
jgi:hypothetical protein